MAMSAGISETPRMVSLVLRETHSTLTLFVQGKQSFILEQKVRV